ncbi:MAG: hypothetical protein WBQ44_00285 [Rhodococcus sp. (in: high G+C Gram-positive bacteria)]
MYSSVTHIFSPRECEAIATHIEHTVRQSVSPAWAPGWPGEIEAAVLDAAFSLRAAYGGPETGVRKVVAQWRHHRGGTPIDDLTELAAFCRKPDQLAAILGNRQRTGDNTTTKAEAAARVAAVLVEQGVRSAHQLGDCDDQRLAVTVVPGIGDKTWENVLFVAGIRTENGIGLLRSFASQALGCEVDAATAASLIEYTAEGLGIRQAHLEHAIWRYQRRVGVTAPLVDAG